MKKSLLIRWAVILVILVGWCWSIFPVRDQDFLKEFNRLSKKGVAQLQKEAARIEKLQAAQAKVKPESKDYQKRQADINEILKSHQGRSPSELLESWKKFDAALQAKMAALAAEEKAGNAEAKDLDEAALKARVSRKYGFKAVSEVVRDYGIHLADFVKVKGQNHPSNKVVMRFVRMQTAGRLRLGLDLQGGTEFQVAFDEASLKDGQDATVTRDQILEILRNRLDKSGVTEPEVKALDSHTISVRMPSLDEGDREGIRQTIRGSAKLEFYLVAQNNAELVAKYNAAEDKSKFAPPAGVQRFVQHVERQGIDYEESIFLEVPATKVKGEDITTAVPSADQFGQWEIRMEFNSQGAKDFGEVTSANVNRQLAIVLDGTVYSAPNIQTAITGGQAQITGSFTFEEVRRLSGVISSGNLPVSIKIESEFGTAPKLGSDSIRYGSIAGVIGLALVILFMLFYYRFCGLVADIALMVNVLLVLGTVALTKATITMPGIAGMVLTIGMAVDANVLIFERMREEMRRGKNLATTVANGFGRVFWTIFDANLTTLLTCFILYFCGSGTVQGFAVTLGFGVASSMFTALFMSHAIFDLFIHNDWLHSISMMEFKALADTKIDFCGFMKKALCIGGALILLGVIGFLCRLDTVFGIDFAGGTQITYTCDGAHPDVAKIREYLKGQGYDTASVGYKTGQSGNKELEIVVPALKVGDEEFSKSLDQAFPECKLMAGNTNKVGPSVGRKFRDDSMWAAIWSMVAIVVYLAFRFDGWVYGFGAVVALIHDVLVSGGLFIVFCRGQLSLTVVAALLTIIGYSINDTIVIFDRVRETQALRRDISYREMLNLAINNTLSRTFLTTLTTMLVTICLLVFGGGVIFDFAIVMFFGLISGTFSSICIAPAVLLKWHRRAAQDAILDKAKKA